VEPLPDVAERAARDAGLALELVKHHGPHERHFGNAIAVYRLGSLGHRFVRDRSQELVDIGRAGSPRPFVDALFLGLALGWITAEHLDAMTDPEPLTAVLARIAAHRKELEEAFHDDRAAAKTSARVRDAREAYWRRRDRARGS
jgi:hypothetical protein